MAPKTYSWDSQEHYDKLLLTKHGMSDDAIQETSQTAPPLFDECTIVGKMVAVDGDALGWEKRQRSKRIPFMKAIKQPDEIAVSPDDLASTTRAGDLVVVMLKHEHTLLFRH